MGLKKTHPRGSSGSPSAIFVSGLKTWQALAQKGYWINGSSDGLGHQKVDHYLESKALALLHGPPSLPLATYSATRQDSSYEGKGELVACYERRVQKEAAKADSPYAQQLCGINSFFWTSYPQFELFQKHFPQVNWQEKHHCCGMGRTFQEFTKRGIEVYPFVDFEQFVLSVSSSSGQLNIS